MIGVAIELAAGFGLLYLGGEALVAGSVRLARRVGISPLAVGLTVVAFGTSSPELVVSLDAASRGANGIVIGSIVGSNICNLLLVLGLAALARPIEVRRKLLTVDLPILLLASGALLLMLQDDRLGRVEGALLLGGLIAYTVFSLRRARREAGDPGGAPVPVLPRVPAPLLLAAGLALLALGAHLFVDGAVALARSLGVSEATIGLSVVAVGTSLPEISAGVLAAYRRQGDIAVGNAVGSCIFNVLGILGVAAVVRPVARGGVAWPDLGLAALAPLLVLPVAWTGHRLSRFEGAALLAGYAAYIGWRVAG